MELNETNISSNLEDEPESMMSVGEQTPEANSGSSLGQTKDHYYSSSQLSLQTLVQPQPQPYPYPQPQSHREPAYSRPARHFCPVTLVTTAGSFCSHCRSSPYSLDEYPSPPPVPPSSPSLSPVGNDKSNLEVDTERLCAEADDLERRVMQFTEIIRRLTHERDSLQRRVSDLERRLRTIEDFGLYSRWSDNSEREPLLDNVSWEDVDRETELEAGSVISSQDAKELDTEIVRIDPEWFSL